MAASLVRSRAMIARMSDRHRWDEVADGAVLQQDGIIAAIGTYRDLSRRYPRVPVVVGTGNEIVLPSFVNALLEACLRRVKANAFEPPPGGDAAARSACEKN